MALSVSLCKSSNHNQEDHAYQNSGQKLLFIFIKIQPYLFYLWAFAWSDSVNQPAPTPSGWPCTWPPPWAGQSFKGHDVRGPVHHHAGHQVGEEEREVVSALIGIGSSCGEDAVLLALHLSPARHGEEQLLDKGQNNVSYFYRRHFRPQNNNL